MKLHSPFRRTNGSGEAATRKVDDQEKRAAEIIQNAERTTQMIESRVAALQAEAEVQERRP